MFRECTEHGLVSRRATARKESVSFPPLHSSLFQARLEAEVEPQKDEPDVSQQMFGYRCWHSGSTIQDTLYSICKECCINST